MFIGGRNASKHGSIVFGAATNHFDAPYTNVPRRDTKA
jgi:hypothetical protein